MKLLKRFIEFIFIFVLPLIIILFCCSYEKCYNYDNDNLKSEIKELSFDIPFEVYKEPKYNNYLDFNQFARPVEAQGNFYNYGLTITNNLDGSYTINGTCSNSNAYAVLGGFWSSEYSEQIFYLNFLGDISHLNINYGGAPIIFNLSSSSNYLIYFENNYTYINQIISPQFIDLTQMFGSGYEPNSVSELNNILDLSVFYPYTVSSEFIIHSNDILSSNYDINYSFYGQIKNFIYDIFNIQDSTISNIIYCYLSFVIIMLIIWYSLYVPIDLLFGLLLRRLSYYE